MRAARGFTLVELMIVLVIIGIGTTLVTLKLVPDPARRLQAEAQQLAQAFAAAQSQARVDGRTIEWRADARGYRFVRAPLGDAGTPDDFRADELLHPRAWQYPGTQVTPRPAMHFGPEWIDAGWRLRLSDGQASVEIVRDPMGRLRVVRP